MRESPSTQCNFRHFAEHSAVPLALLGPGNVLEYANRAFRKLLPPPELDEVQLRDLPCPPELLDRLEQGLATVRRAGKELSLRWEGAFTAEPSVYECRLVPSWDGGQQVILEVGELPLADHLREALASERMDRRRAERLKERGRRLFFNAIDSWPVFVYMQRPDYTVAYANRLTKAYYGETEGRSCYEVFGGRTSPCVNCPTFRVFDTGEPEEWEFTDSEGRTFRIYDYPFEDDDGQPLVMELGIDITELKRVERELYQAQKMRAIGVLAGGIAHDLNNSLVPIIFNVDHALNKLHTVPQAQELAKPLDEALRAAYRAADLVEQVLDYSRQQNLSREPLHVAQLARESMDLLRASLPDGIDLKVHYLAERDCIYANPSQVQQLLLNLCRNAVQAMPKGGTLEVRLENAKGARGKDSPHPGLASGDDLLLSVLDTGHGINPDDVERIFEPFYTTKKSTGGTGMGLAVVHSIVTSNGGVLDVDTAPGRGTTFRVYLPLAVEAVNHMETPQLESEPGGDSCRLLLVDDDHNAMEAMRRVLTDAGFAVHTEPGGQQGLHAYLSSQKPFDLVMADHSMPGMDGLEMAARMLEHDPEALVVICTGHVEPELERRAREVGIVGFLMKPMTPARLVENVSRYCRAARQAQRRPE